MKSITIAQRLVWMIASSVVALLVVGFIGLNASEKATDGIRKINGDSLPSIVLINEAKQGFLEIRSNSYDHVLSTDEATKQKIEKSLDSKAEEVLKLLKDYEMFVEDDEDKKMLASDVRNMKSYLQSLREEILPASHNTDVAIVRFAISAEIAPLATELLRGFNEHIAYNKRLAEESANTVLTHAARGKIMALFASAVD